MRRRRFLGAGAGGAFAAVVLASSTSSSAQDGARIVPIVARKFVFIPGEIVVRRGESIVLELTAPEVVMGFFAPDLGLRALIVPGQVVRVAFRADRVGRFDFLCDVFCGDGHEGMSGHLVVQG